MDSGRGIRTIVEQLNLKIHYHFNTVNCTSDIIIDVLPVEAAGANRNVEFNWDLLRVPQSIFLDSTCIENVDVLGRVYPLKSVHLVSSIEDAMLCVFIMSRFGRPIIPTTPPSPPPPSYSSLGGNAPLFDGKSTNVRSSTDSAISISSPYQSPQPLRNTIASDQDIVSQHSKYSVDTTSNSPSKKRTSGEDDNLQKIFLVLKVASLRIVVVDNVVGLHLPLFQIFVEDQSLTFDSTEHISTPASASDTEADPELRVRVFGSLRCFADYFNYACKCWEPLLEPIICEMLYEQSAAYRGFSLRSKSNVHFNVSGAFIKALTELMRVVKEDMSGSASLLNVLDMEFDDRAFTHLRRSSVSSSMNPMVDSSQAKEILHLPSQVLSDDMRVGFSIVNATGQTLRYLVDHGEDHKVIRYLRNGDRGILNFPATQFLIRNGRVVEETFDLQREKQSSLESNRRNDRTQIGHMIGFQISGFKWVETEADLLGARYEPLSPVLGRLDPSHLYESQWKYLNALVLMAEVTTASGGRQLRLRSVFEVVNKTDHRIHVMLQNGVESDDGSNNEENNRPFIIESGQRLYIPIGLLQTSMLKSGGKCLGLMRMRAADLAVVKNEIGVTSRLSTLRLNYSSEPIKLVDLLDKSYDMLHAAASGSGKYDQESIQLVCKIDSEIREAMSPAQIVAQQLRPLSIARSKHDSQTQRPLNSKIPPFIYNVEVVREASFQNYLRGVFFKCILFFRVLDSTKSSKHELKRRLPIFSSRRRIEALPNFAKSRCTTLLSFSPLLSFRTFFLASGSL